MATFGKFLGYLLLAFWAVCAALSGSPAVASGYAASAATALDDDE